MNSQEASKRTEPGETIIGYFHVSPVKISKRNNRYFNALFQIDRYEYLNTVVFSPEKHNEVSMAARNKTALKVHNARK